MATSCRRVLSVVDGIPFERRLTTVPGGLRRSNTLGQPMTCCLLELNTALALRVPDCPLVEFTMEEVVPNHFILQRCERVLDVTKVAHVQPIPVYKVGTAIPALSAFLLGHVP